MAVKEREEQRGLPSVRESVEAAAGKGGQEMGTGWFWIVDADPSRSCSSCRQT